MHFRTGTGRLKPTIRPPACYILWPSSSAAKPGIKHPSRTDLNSSRCRRANRSRYARPCGEVNLDTALVVAACHAPHPAGRLASGHARDDAVMLGLKALGQFSHRGPTSARVALDLQHQLVLQRRDAVPVRHFLVDADLSLTRCADTQMTRGIGEMLCVGKEIGRRSRVTQLSAPTGEVDQSSAGGNTAASHHHEDEEQDLFPALLESMAGSDAVCLRDLTSSLSSDHQALEQRWAILRQQLVQVAEGTASTFADSDVPGFVQLYEQHIVREEAELLPMAARLLSDTELDRIGLAMRARRSLVPVHT